MHTRYTYHIRGVAENAWADQWYIGSRTATHGRTPEEDIGIHYFTSSTNDDFVAQFKAHPEWFVCTILERGYSDDVVMGEDEERRITESWNVPGRINRKGYLPLFERDESYKANVAAGLRKMHVSPEYQETRRKMRATPEYQETMRKMYASPEWKAKNVVANRKMRATPEYQETRRNLQATPEWKANVAAANRKSAQNPVHRATRAAANRKMHASPEYQETMRKVRATPEWKAKNAAANRKKHASPEWKAKQAAGARKNALDPVWKANVAAGKKRARALRDAAKTSTDTTDVL